MSENKIMSEALPNGTVIKSTRYEYRVEKIIGAGGFGITYKVVRTSDYIVFAMKEFFPSTLCQRDTNCTLSYLRTNSNKFEEGVRNFITEAERLSKLNISHSNIISVTEVFESNNTAYYVMDYIDGINLRQFVKKQHNKPLTQEQMISVMTPILQAVALLHEKKLAHLDIKHENIVLTVQPDGSMRPVLIDFGQSKHYDRKGNATSTLTNAGCSDGFSPQEQYLGLDKFTPQADVYALCATMLYLLTAKQPPKSSDISTAYIESALPPEISASVRKAIVNGMRKDKDDRTQTVERLAEELEIDINTSTEESSVTRLLNIPGRRKFGYSKIAVYAAGAALMTGILGSGLYWYDNRLETMQQYIAPTDTLTAVEPVRIVGNTLTSTGKQPSPTPTSEEESTNMTATDDEANSTGRTNEDKFRQALRENNFNELLSLAKAGYAKAYYPVALGYYNRGNKYEAERWARNAMKKNSDVKKALALIEKITLSPNPANLDNGSQPDEDLFAKATTLSDFKMLADRGYAKAYAPLAERYFASKNYNGANIYARKALSANIGKQQAISVVEKLDVIGYYDNGENGGKPKY